MNSGNPPDTGWRVAVVLLSCLFTTCAAHAAAGGGSPGPGGLVAVAAILVPVALSVRVFGSGPFRLAAVAALGQITGHLALGVVAGPGPGGHSAHHDHAAAAADSGAPVHYGTLADHAGSLATDPTPIGHGGHGSLADLTAAMDAAGGWDALWSPMTHAAHLGPAMLGSHLVAVVVTVVLIGAVSAAVVRAGLRFVALLRTLLLPATPVGRTWTGDAVRRVVRAPHLAVRPQRGPPVHS